MELRSINSRADLDAIAGTPEHEKFMALLAGSLWRLEKDDQAQTWRAVEDDGTVSRFGFSRADFPDAHPPALPAYIPPPSTVPQQVTRAQGKAVLIQMGLWQQVLDFVAAITDPVQRAVAEVAINDTQHWQRNSPFLTQAAAALGITSEQMDQLFIQASEVML
jgi:hypothetical protein